MPPKKGKNEPEAEKIYKIVILGGGGVGKSCLTIRLILGTFKAIYDPTIEDLYRKDMEVDGEIIKMEICDTAGQDEMAGMRDLYYKQGDGFLLCYSVDMKSSMEDVRERFQSVMSARGGDKHIPPVIVVGNKADLDYTSKIGEDGKPQATRCVSPEEGQELAKELGENVGWIETSAKSDTGVNKVFEEILKRVNVQKQSILKETQDENSGCCCIC